MVGNIDYTISRVSFLLTLKNLPTVSSDASPMQCHDLCFTQSVPSVRCNVMRRFGLLGASALDTDHSKY